MSTDTPTPERVTLRLDACWHWPGNRNPPGYGRVPVQGYVRPAHRVIYEAARGPIEAGKELDHLCRNRACVNPDHLEPVTHAENVRRAVSGRANAETCRNDLHPWPASAVLRSGKYRCFPCERAASHERYLRRKGKLS